MELPGLQGWISSAPLELGFDGGDIHYLSACDYGVLSRVVLADVSGHGRLIAAVAEELLRLVRDHMNRLEQSALLMELSASLSAMKANDAATHATAIAVGFDSMGGDLTVTDAAIRRRCVPRSPTSVGAPPKAGFVATWTTGWHADWPGVPHPTRIPS